ncbi:MAG: hypothetical protein WC054_00170 [Candidatus Nanopelagicales bacterium]
MSESYPQARRDRKADLRNRAALVVDLSDLRERLGVVRDIGQLGIEAGHV